MRYTRGGPSATYLYFSLTGKTHPVYGFCVVLCERRMLFIVFLASRLGLALRGDRFYEYYVMVPPFNTKRTSSSVGVKGDV